MLEKITNLCKRTISLNQNEVFKLAFEDLKIKKYVIKLIQEQLYNDGENGNGQSLGEYSKATIYGTSNFKGKIEKNQPYDRVTLKDTGAFYKSMQLIRQNNYKFTVQVDNVSSGVDLRDIYGDAIVELNDENFENVCAMVVIFCQKYTSKKMLR